jgi:hypothetical protein
MVMRMETIRLTGILLCVVMMLSAGAAYGKTKEVGGFGGLSWGASLPMGEFDEIQDARKQYKSVESFRRKDTSVSFGGVPVENISYNFWNGRFYSVSMDVRGFLAYMKLLAYCDREFGPRVAFMGRGEESLVSFESGDTAYLLNYYVPPANAQRGAVNSGRLFIYSKTLDQQMDRAGATEMPMAAMPSMTKDSMAAPKSGMRGNTSASPSPTVPGTRSMTDMQPVAPKAPTEVQPMTAVTPRGETPDFGAGKSLPPAPVTGK